MIASELGFIFITRVLDLFLSQIYNVTLKDESSHKRNIERNQYNLIEGSKKKTKTLKVFEDKNRDL